MRATRPEIWLSKWFCCEASSAPWESFANSRGKTGLRSWPPDASNRVASWSSVPRLRPLPNGGSQLAHLSPDGDLVCTQFVL